MKLEADLIRRYNCKLTDTTTGLWGKHGEPLKYLTYTTKQLEVQAKLLYNIFKQTYEGQNNG